MSSIIIVVLDIMFLLLFVCKHGYRIVLARFVLLSHCFILTSLDLEFSRLCMGGWGMITPTPIVSGWPCLIWVPKVVPRQKRMKPSFPLPKSGHIWFGVLKVVHGKKGMDACFTNSVAGLLVTFSSPVPSLTDKFDFLNVMYTLQISLGQAYSFYTLTGY